MLLLSSVPRLSLIHSRSLFSLSRYKLKVQFIYLCVCVCSPGLTVLMCVLFRLRCMHILFRDLNIAKIEKVSYLRIVDYLRKHKKIYCIYIYIC